MPELEIVLYRLFALCFTRCAGREKCVKKHGESQQPRCPRSRRGSVALRPHLAMGLPFVRCAEICDSRRGERRSETSSTAHFKVMCKLEIKRCPGGFTFAEKATINREVSQFANIFLVSCLGSAANFLIVRKTMTVGGLRQMHRFR